MLILVTAFGLPVFAGAIFGGLVLGRWGWIAELLFGSGWALIVFLISNDSFRLIYDGRSLGPVPSQKMCGGLSRSEAWSLAVVMRNVSGIGQQPSTSEDMLCRCSAHQKSSPQ